MVVILGVTVLISVRLFGDKEGNVFAYNSANGVFGPVCGDFWTIQNVSFFQKTQEKKGREYESRSIQTIDVNFITAMSVFLIQLAVLQDIKCHF